MDSSAIYGSSFKSSNEKSKEPSSLPEAVPVAGLYPDVAPKFAIIPPPDSTPKYVYDADSGVQQKQRLWQRWPFLLLLSILLAIIAGIVGGFIGKTIEANRNTNLHAAQMPAPSTNSTPSPSGPNTNTTASNTTSLDLPKTGCPEAHNKTAQSDALRKPYKLFCNLDWVGNDFAGISAHSVSDCIEACDGYNRFISEGDKKCMGTTFVPAWINKTAAIEISLTSGNCFFKSKIEGYPENNYAYLREVVGMCFSDTCP